MFRHTRYQGVFLRDDHILLIRHEEYGGRTYWLLPGGGIEAGETEEECVIREMREELGVEVRVQRLLSEEPAHAESVYQIHKNYLCEILSGEPAPGYEPEEEASSVYGIAEVGWFDLRTPDSWPEIISLDPITSWTLQRLRIQLGYAVE